MAVGIMEVLLVNAKGLGNTDFLGKMDPYVLLKYKGQERKSSVARDAGRSPSWNETFRFRVEYPGNGAEYKLNLTIMDHDNFSADDLIGHTTIFVGDLLALGAEKGSSQLRPTKYRVVRADNSYCGEIQIGVTFNVKAEEEGHARDFGGWQQSES